MRYASKSNQAGSPGTSHKRRLLHRLVLTSKELRFRSVARRVLVPYRSRLLQHFSIFCDFLEVISFISYSQRCLTNFASTFFTIVPLINAEITLRTSLIVAPRYCFNMEGSWQPQEDSLRQILQLLKEAQLPDNSTQSAVSQVSNLYLLLFNLVL